MTKYEKQLYQKREAARRRGDEKEWMRLDEEYTRFIVWKMQDINKGLDLSYRSS